MLSTIPLKGILLLSTFMMTLGASTYKLSDNTTTENSIVLIKFKAQPDKGDLAVSELTKLLKKVKGEPHFVRITLHVDPEDNTNIMLYEEWDDISYYKTDHMETDHLQNFMANSNNFLTGPPDISFWTVDRVIN